MTTPTFTALLAERTRPAADPGRPLVTWYGPGPGERVELSVTSWANWVAKTASLLQDELDVTRGDLVVLDLPSHWLGTVWPAACWAVGAVAAATSGRHQDDAALVVCGPLSVEELAAGPVPVVASSLDPLGARFSGPLPTGVVDFGEVVWAQPDAFTPWDPAEPDDPAWQGAAETLSQQDLVCLAQGSATGLRVATTAQPVGDAGIRHLLHALGSGGGTVWVPSEQADRLPAIAATEHAVVQPA